MTDRERFYLYLNGACPTGPEHELMGAFLAALAIGRKERTVEITEKLAHYPECFGEGDE